MPRNSLIETYLNRLEEALALSRSQKARIREEIWDHLLTAVEEEVRRGYSRSDAERRAIERFGSPAEVAAQLTSSKRRLHRRSQSKREREMRRPEVPESHQFGEGAAERCSFCGKPSEKVRQLVNGPAGIAICDECLQLCTEVISSARAQRTPSAGDARQSASGGKQQRRDAHYFCSFCNRESADVEKLIAGPGFVFVCSCCVEEFTTATV